MPGPIMPGPIIWPVCSPLICDMVHGADEAIMPGPIIWPVSSPLICDMVHGADEAIPEMAVAPISKLSKAVVKYTFFMLSSSLMDRLAVYFSLWQRLLEKYG